MKQSNTFKRLGSGIILTAFLLCCLIGTSFSLHPKYAWAESPIANLNNGNAVIDMNEEAKFFEPGMRIKKEFTIENLSKSVDGKPADAYHYGFYFREKINPSEPDVIKPLTGDLAEVIEVTIFDASTGKKLVGGTLASMNRENVIAAVNEKQENDILEAGDPKNLILQLRYPTDVGNKGMGKSITDFEICLVFSETPVNQESQTL